MTNWKTTLAGIITGAGLAAQAIEQASTAGTFNGKTGTQLLIAIGIVLLGICSKDYNVTGGTVVNENNNASVVASIAQLDKGSSSI